MSCRGSLLLRFEWMYSVSVCCITVSEPIAVKQKWYSVTLSWKHSVKLEFFICFIFILVHTTTYCSDLHYFLFQIIFIYFHQKKKERKCWHIFLLPFSVSVSILQPPYWTWPPNQGLNANKWTNTSMTILYCITLLPSVAFTAVISLSYYMGLLRKLVLKIVKNNNSAIQLLVHKQQTNKQIVFFLNNSVQLMVQYLPVTLRRRNFLKL